MKYDKLNPRQWKEKISSGGVLSDDGKTWYPSESYKFGATSGADQNVSTWARTVEDFERMHDFLRPVMVSIHHCENVLLEDVTFQNSPCWNIHPAMCTNLIVNNITVRCPDYAQNSDGIDIESCRNVSVTNSRFDVGDDGICIKSGKDQAGRDRGIPCENILVDNCIVFHGHGGFVVGSEMSGGVRNVKVSNCVFSGTDVGLRFKSTRGRGGVVENIHIEDITMNNILQEPLLFDLFYGGKSASEARARGRTFGPRGEARRRDHAGLPRHPYPQRVVPRRQPGDVLQRSARDERRARDRREYADLRPHGCADQRVFGCRAAQREGHSRRGAGPAAQQREGLYGRELRVPRGAQSRPCGDGQPQPRHRRAFGADRHGERLVVEERCRMCRNQRTIQINRDKL